ncbi:MAG: agmatinase [Bacteroidota bacterium]|nr:agmatinase [Bacteroidota bacterium]
MTLFGDFEEKYTEREGAQVAILPVPYDGTSTWIKGADKGPEALLDASYNLEFYDIETDSEVYLQGIYTHEPVTEASSPEAMAVAVEKSAGELIDEGKFVLMLGGEHSVSIGTIKAHADRFPNLTVLQLDAHSDLRDEYHDSKYNHACVMARAQELCPIVQVGIRSMDSGELTRMERSHVFFAENIHDNKEWMDKAIDLMTDNVYLTIDLDVYDPAILPGTGTPEPGGLLWYPVLEFLRKVYERKNVVGADVVELCPIQGNKTSEFFAAKLVYKLLTYKFCLEK